MKVWMIVATLGDVEVAMEVADSLETAVDRACSLQLEIAMENGVDEDEATEMNDQFADKVNRNLDNGRREYAEITDAMDISWRFKHTKVKTD